MKNYDDLILAFARSHIGGKMFVRVFNPVDRFLMKWTRGRLNVGVGSRFRRNAVLLGCRGARTGQRREVPLLATRVGDDFVLIASNGGARRHPAWYFNLSADPECTLTIDGQVLRCTAREAQGEERERLFQAAIENYAGYADYQAHTARVIPVMVVTPRG